MTISEDFHNFCSGILKLTLSYVFIKSYGYAKELWIVRQKLLEVDLAREIKYDKEH